MALIALPCGRGFCHSQPRSAVCASAGGAVMARIRTIPRLPISLVENLETEKLERKGFRKGSEGIALCVPWFGVLSQLEQERSTKSHETARTKPALLRVISWIVLR